MSRFLVFLALSLLDGPALAQGFDDPRVADYAAMLAGLQHTQQEILARRARICASGLTEYCQPMPFVPQMSVEEFRARLAKAK